MKLEQIHEMWDVDAKINPTELDTESLKISELHSKYFRIFNKERLILIKLEKELIVLRRDKYEFYTQGPSEDHLRRGWEYPGVKILKNEANIYIDSDNDVVELSLKIAFQKEKIDLLEHIIRSLNGRSFQIKHAIDFLRWSHGQN
jgi:hypothetical protein